MTSNNTDFVKITAPTYIDRAVAEFRVKVCALERNSTSTTVRVSRIPFVSETEGVAAS